MVEQGAVVISEDHDPHLERDRMGLKGTELRRGEFTAGRRSGGPWGDSGACHAFTLNARNRLAQSDLREDIQNLVSTTDTCPRYRCGIAVVQPCCNANSLRREETRSRSTFFSDSVEAVDRAVRESSQLPRWLRLP